MDLYSFLYLNDEAVDDKVFCVNAAKLCSITRADPIFSILTQFIRTCVFRDADDLIFICFVILA